MFASTRTRWGITEDWLEWDYPLQPVNTAYQSVRNPSCSSSRLRNSSKAERRAAAFRWRRSNTSSRLKRVCDPFLNELIRPSATHFIRVGLEILSRSAATVL